MGVSVIVPYNKDRGFLDQCLKSLEHEPCKIIFSKSDQGVAYNFNRGLEKVETEFVKFIAEDDYMVPGAIWKLREGIKDRPWVVGNSYRVRDGKVVEYYKPYDLRYAPNVKRNYIDGGTTLYRTDTLREIGGMREELWTGEEYDMHLRLFQKGYHPGYVDHFIYYHRLWEGQKSRLLRNKNLKKRQNEIKKIQALHYDEV